MSKINPLDSAKLAADILSILVAANGRESANTVSESLRGGWRSPYSPESGRRWKGLSNIHDLADAAEELGFTIVREYVGPCLARTYITL